MFFKSIIAVAVLMLVAVIVGLRLSLMARIGTGGNADGDDQADDNGYELAHNEL